MYGILRTNKIKLKDVNKRISEHNQRVNSADCRSNELTRPELSSCNVRLINSDNWRRDIDNLLEQHNISRVRKDAIGLIDCVITASQDFFKGKTISEITDFFVDSLPLFQEEFGTIISASIHFDERTPHMHVDCVPIVQNQDNTYSLSAKRGMGNQAAYVERQDKFHEEFFKNYGLERGVSKGITHDKHVDHREFKELERVQERYREVCHNITLKQAEIDVLAKRKEEYERILEQSIERGNMARFLVDSGIFDKKAERELEQESIMGEQAEIERTRLNEEWDIEL